MSYFLWYSYKATQRGCNVNKYEMADGKFKNGNFVSSNNLNSTTLWDDIQLIGELKDPLNVVQFNVYNNLSVNLNKNFKDFDFYKLKHNYNLSELTVQKKCNHPPMALTAGRNGATECYKCGCKNIHSV